MSSAKLRIIIPGGSCAISIEFVSNGSGDYLWIVVNNDEEYARTLGKIAETALAVYVMPNIEEDMKPKWKTFVLDYLRTVALNTSNINTWYRKACNLSFRYYCNLLWTRSTGKFWRIQASTIEYSETKFSGKYKKRLGSGLFCVVPGEHRIEFGAEPFSTWTSQCPKEFTREARYAIGPAWLNSKRKKMWYLPTAMSFETGLIHHGFKVQFSEDDRKITHELLFEEGKYFLHPKRFAKVGEEFCYRYYPLSAPECTQICL